MRRAPRRRAAATDRRGDGPRSGRSRRHLPDCVAQAPPPPFPLPPRPHALRSRGALAALLAAVLVVALVAAFSGGGTPSVKQLSARRSRTAARAGHARKPRRSGRRSDHREHDLGRWFRELDAERCPRCRRPGRRPALPQGHQLLAQGAYTQAIPTLRRAVAAAAPGSVQQGYALYDLGQALFLSGDPAAAVPILEQRMQINDQLPTVRKLLDAALAASGAGQQRFPRGRRRPQVPSRAPGGNGHGHGGRTAAAEAATEGPLRGRRSPPVRAVPPARP